LLIVVEFENMIAGKYFITKLYSNQTCKAGLVKLSGQGHPMQDGIAARFHRGRRDIADRLETAAMIEPGHLFGGDEFHCGCVTPWRSPMESRGLE
jgi:hypothetical protein